MASMALIPVLERLFHGLANDDARRFAFDLPRVLRVDGSALVDGTTERIDHAANQLRTHRDFEHSAGPADFVAFFESSR